MYIDIERDVFRRKQKPLRVQQSTYNMYITRVFGALGFGRRRRRPLRGEGGGKDERRARKKQCVCGHVSFEYAIICENTILLFGRRNLYSSSTWGNLHVHLSRRRRRRRGRIQLQSRTHFYIILYIRERSLYHTRWSIPLYLQRRYLPI